jgi:hypothetical protein
MAELGSLEVYDVSPIQKVYGYGDEGDENLNQNDQGCLPGLQYLGLKYNQPVYSWLEKKYALPLPTDLAWFDPRNTTPGDSALPTSKYFSHTGLVFLRTEWNNPNALYAAMKGGANYGITHQGHSDLEIGSFVLDALGVRWAIDLGRDSYGPRPYWNTDPTKIGNRWEYYRKRPEGNNTLVINPDASPGQALNGMATLVKFRSDATVQQVVLDLSSVYPETTSAQRGLRLINGTFQLQDEITASSPLDLNWFMHTRTTITLGSDNRTATLASDNVRLLLTIQSPATGTFSVMDAVPLPGSPHPHGQADNKGVQKLRILVPQAQSPITLSVAMCPYHEGEKIPVLPPVIPLNSW